MFFSHIDAGKYIYRTYVLAGEYIYGTYVLQI